MADPDATSMGRIIIGVPEMAGVTVTSFSAAMPTITLSSGLMI
jgi:hypothetical protein